MRPVSDFFPRLLVSVPACPEPLATQAVVDSAIHFCEKSLAYRYTPDTVPTVIGQSIYDFDLPTNSDFSRVIYLNINGREISSRPTEQLPLHERPNSSPTEFFVSQNEAELLLNLFPTPDDVYTIDMSIALRPQRDTEYLDDDLYTYWQEAIIYGALYRLMAVPGQAFSDPAAATYYQRQADAACHSAKIEGNIGRITGSLQVKPRPFA